MKISRRDFIKQTGVVSIGFSLLGTSCLGDKKAKGSDEPDNATTPSQEQVDSWLQILENGKILILTGKIELGQGIQTAIMQVAAEELNTNINLVDVNLAETGVTPNEGYTAGSQSIETSAMSIRYAAATAREILFQLAAEKYNSEQQQFEIKDGFIFSGSEKISFSQLLDGNQIHGKINRSARLRARKNRSVVGSPVKRRDLENIIRGKQVFLQDLRFPNMVHARIIRPDAYTSKLNSIDTSVIEKEEGLLKIVKEGSFIGVLAEEEFQAIQFKEALDKSTTWETEEKLPVEGKLKDHLKSIPSEDETVAENGDWEKAIKNAEIQHKAAYYKPYIMHAANGPSCAIALFQNKKLTVWTHSQGVYPLRKTLANLLKLKENEIHVIGIPGSGCYGHNGADDVAAEAAIMALNYPDRHIRLQWMREDEHGWEPYGTAMVMELEAGITKEGKIQGWKYDFWSDGHSSRPNGTPENLLPARFMDQGHGVPGIGFKGGASRNSKPIYTIDALKAQAHFFRGPLRKSALRGLGAYANIFAIECFMDELAYKAGENPLDFRLKHLNDNRAKECLQSLRRKTSGLKTKEREGIGFAFAQYKNEASYFAVAAHVFVHPETGETTVNKMWGIIDSGECINPDGLKNQTEGGMIQSASWALKEEVHYNTLHITSLDWETYPIFRFPDVPEVEVEVIDRIHEPPLGAGEAAQGPSTAAIINAIFNASGVRVRDLPVQADLLKSS